MPRLFRIATVLVSVAIALNGCSRLASQTELPSTLASEPPSGQPVTTASPTISAPSASPTDAPSPTDEPAPTDSPLGTWRPATDFPPAGATVSSVVAGGPGFVAVGSVPSERGGCEELRDGRIWTSQDGEHWTEAADDELAEVELAVIVNSAGTLYAFGQIGSWDCARGVTIWRSSDGAAWEELPESPTFRPGDGIVDVTVSDDTLIAVGYVNAAGDRTGVWTSTDGIDWNRSEDSPRSWLNTLDTVASLGDLVVAMNSFHGRPAWYSTDLGQTWRTSDFGPLYRMNSLDSAGGGGLIIEVGAACCGLPDTEVGVAMSTPDGISWTLSEPQAFRRVAEHIVALPDGFLAVGTRTRLSSDGMTWQVGPPLPDLESRDGVAAAASSTAVVVVAGAGTWFAPIDELAIERWPEPARAAEMPELGVRYPYQLFTHCGIPPIRFALGTWLPDGDPGYNPPPGFDELDNGWLTQISADRAEYISRNGGSISLHRAEEPQEPSPCA